MGQLNDGFSTTIAFADFPGVLFYEKEVTPPGASGGGPNDTTTMKNTALRTLAPKKLKTLEPASLTASYDPAVYGDIFGMINVNQLITITFPDDSTYAFWGYIDQWSPGAIVEGEQPTADVTIQPTNQNDSNVETAPVYAAGA